MTNGIYESDEWVTSMPTLLDVLPAVKRALDQSPLIMEHWLYRRASAPKRYVFDSPEQLDAYLREKALPGDSFYFWDFSSRCSDDSALARGKFPDSEGRVPKRGAY